MTNKTLCRRQTSNASRDVGQVDYLPVKVENAVGVEASVKVKVAVKQVDEALLVR